MSVRLTASLMVAGLLLMAAPASAAQGDVAFSIVQVWRGDPGTAVVAGTYACGPFASNGGTVDLTLRQGEGASARTGYGYVPIDVCDGQDQPYQAVVSSVDGQPFAVGSATALASGYACPLEGPCQHTGLIEQTVYVAPVQPTFAFSVDGARRGSNPATVIVDGSYTCGPLASNGNPVDMTIRQGQGSGEVSGSGFVTIAVCDGTPQRYSTTLQSNDGRRFKKGAATVLASGYVCAVDGSVCQTTSMEPQVVTIGRPN